VFTSPEAVSVPENSTAVMTVTAVDPDQPAQPVTFSIVGGADQSKFTITTGGALSFVTPPNFEAPTDANGDNVYVVIVQATDGTFSTLQAILVSVTNLSEVTLAGDFNNNGVVDTADYVLWRNGGPLANDPTPGVQPADYNVWRANFGRTAGAGTSAFGDDGGVNRSLAIAQRPAHRPEQRETFVGAATRDDALLAWLGLRAADSDRRPLSGAAADWIENTASDESLETSIDSLDVAFAAL
jgi:hypothetical protein